MRRLTAWLAAALMVFVWIPCLAAGGFYCEYTPKSERSSLFYIEICSTDEMSAAVMELSFNNSLVEYRDVTPVAKSSSARAVCDGGCVKIAFSDSGAVKGRVCRVAFKALQPGTCTFTLHISQAADGTPKMLSGLSDHNMEVKLGKEDIPASASSKGSTASLAKGSSSSRSSVSGSYEDDEEHTPANGALTDLRRNRALTYALIGAGAVLLIAGLVFAGVMIGRKTARKKKAIVSDETIGAESDSKIEDEPTAVKEGIAAIGDRDNLIE